MDLDTALHFLGSEHEDEVERGRAAVLARAEAAHPRLLELLESGEPDLGRVAGLLGEIGRPESVAPLTLALERAWAARFEVASALARHPAAEARLALEAALDHADPEVVGDAAAGLELRGDPQSCAALGRHLAHAHPGARYRIVRAAIACGCLDAEELATLAGEGASADLRRLVEEAAAAGRAGR